MKYICVYLDGCGLSFNYLEEFEDDFITLKYFKTPKDSDFECEWLK